MRDRKELVIWLRSMGNWLLENPLGVDMLTVKDDLMEAANEIESLTRRDQPVPLSDWQKLEAERDKYLKGLLALKDRLELSDQWELLDAVEDVLRIRPENSLTPDLTSKHP